MNDERLFLDDCRFAKVVSTPHGDGILIGGRVFYVTAPERGRDLTSLNYTTLLASALRNPAALTATAVGVGIASVGVQATNPTYFGSAGKAEN